MVYDYYTPAKKKNQDDDTEQLYNPSGLAPTSEEGSEGQKGSSAQAPKTGSNFIDLDQYFQANNPNAVNAQFSGHIQDDLYKGRKAQQDAAAAFQGNADSAYKGISKEEADQTIAGANSGGSNNQDFTKFIQADQKAGGSLADNGALYNQYWGGLNKGIAEAKGAQTDKGRSVLLDEYFGRPTGYSSGAKGLDNAFLKKGGNLHALAQQANQLNQQASVAESDLHNYADKKANEFNQNQDYARSSLGLDANGKVVTGDKAGALGSLQNQITGETAAANAARSAQYDQLTQELGSGKVSPESLYGKLGLMNTDWWGIDPTKSNYLTKGGDLSSGDVASPEEKARLKALYELAGLDQNFLGKESGNAGTNPYAFDRDKFMSDVVGTKSGNFRNDYQGLIKGANGQNVIGNTGIVASGDPRKDIQALIDNIKLRNDYDPEGQQNYIHSNNDAIKELQKLIQKYNL